MRAVLHPTQATHAPKMFLRMGRPQPNPEHPDRIEVLRKAALSAGAVFEMPQDHGDALVLQVHDPDYLAFLRDIHRQWVTMPGAGDEVIANVHPNRQRAQRPDHPIGLAGWYMADTACPISADTWQAAYWSAQTAITATHCALSDGVAYALCRPPGHHAFADMAGGFCFLNNAAIAAQTLRQSYERVAVLDVDVHHGNGTQGIFYDRADVLTVSVHADPMQFYPFFWGHGDEHGAGAGEGANLNLPLPFGAGDREMMAALEQALVRIADFDAQALVVSLGLDAHEGDPFQALKVSNAGFAAMAGAIAAVGLPSVIVQEGGYLHAGLGAALAHFLDGWSKAG